MNARTTTFSILLWAVALLSFIIGCNTYNMLWLFITILCAFMPKFLIMAGVLEPIEEE